MKKVFMVLAMALLTMSMVTPVEAVEVGEEFYGSGSCRKETAFESIGYYWTADGDTATAVVTNRKTGSTRIYTISIGLVDCGGVQ